VSARRRKGPADWEVLRTYLSGSPFSDRSESVVSVMVSDLVGAGTEPMSPAEPMVSVVVSGPLRGAVMATTKRSTRCVARRVKNFRGNPPRRTKPGGSPAFRRRIPTVPRAYPLRNPHPHLPPIAVGRTNPVTTVAQPVAGADPPETPTFGGTPPDQPKHPRGDRVPHASQVGGRPLGGRIGGRHLPSMSQVSGTTQTTSTANGSRTR